MPPGTGFVLGLAGNLQLTITGEVKEGPTVIQVTGGVPNLIGPVNPLVGTSVPLANSVLGFTAMVDFSDTVTVYVPGPLTASTTYFHVTGTGVTSDFATATTDLLSYTTGTVFIPAVTGAFKLGSGVPDN